MTAPVTTWRLSQIDKSASMLPTGTQGTTATVDVRQTGPEFVLASDYEALCLSATARAWQPIETAPKGNRSIMVFCTERKNVYVVTWSDVHNQWAHFGGGGHSYVTEIPTHWMPLPENPK